MTTKTDICNLALGYASDTTLISDVDLDNTAQAIQCRRVFKTYLESTLNDFPWSFARTLKKLSLIDEEDYFYDYVYQFPSDCLTPRLVFDADTSKNAIIPMYSLCWSGIPFPESKYLRFEKGVNQAGDENTIITNLENAYLLYTRNQPDLNVLPQNFIDALAMRIGSFIALTLNESKTRAEQLEKKYREAGANATLRDTESMNTQHKIITESAMIRIR